MPVVYCVQENPGIRYEMGERMIERNGKPEKKTSDKL